MENKDYRILELEQRIKDLREYVKLLEEKVDNVICKLNDE